MRSMNGMEEDGRFAENGRTNDQPNTSANPAGKEAADSERQARLTHVNHGVPAKREGHEKFSWKRMRGGNGGGGV